MSTADVKRLHAETGKPVLVVGRMDKIMWSEVFENNPKITKSRVGCVKLVNGPGLRPYIAGKDTYRWQWRRLRSQQPGEIFLTAEEAAFGQQHGGKIMIEPNVKQNGHANKAWPFERWQDLVDRGGDFIQVGAPSTRWLNGVERVETPTFRLACAVLAASRAFVGTEGALHHAAAALSVPAVVLWAEFISPDVTGYAQQINIRHAGEPCGARIPCAKCVASMAAITVDEVSFALEKLA